MSRAPVREALSRLYAEGLVGFEPPKASFCLKLSAKEITELFELKADFVGAAVSKISHLICEDELNALYTVCLDTQRSVPGLTARQMRRLMQP